MFQAKFKLKHEGCWTEGLKQFKSEFLTNITVSLTKDHSQDITEILIKNDEAAKIKKYFKTNRRIKEMNILDEDNKKMVIQIFTDTSHIKSVVHTILRNNCFVTGKIRLEGGFEI